MWKPSPDYRGIEGKKFWGRSVHEIKPFKVVWSDEWNCWVLSGREHVLVLVQEVWIEGN